VNNTRINPGGPQPATPLRSADG